MEEVETYPIVPYCEGEAMCPLPLLSPASMPENKPDHVHLRACIRKMHAKECENVKGVEW